MRTPSLSRWVPRFLWVILTVALVVGGRTLPWRDALTQTRTLDVPWVIVAIAANFAIIPLWASEWLLLVPRGAAIAWRRMFGVVAAMASAHSAFSFFAGGLTGAALLVTRGGLTQGAAVSVIAMDQLLVGFAKLTVLAVAAMLLPMSEALRTGALALILGVATLAAVLVSIAHRWRAIGAWLRARPARPWHWLAWLSDQGAHLDTVRDPSRLWRVALIALGKKALEIGAIVAVQGAFGFVLSPSSLATAVPVAIVVAAALAVTTTVPLAPANLGVYEATVFATYRLAGAQPDTALGMALVQHACFLLPMIATGWITFSVGQLRQRAGVARS